MKFTKIAKFIIIVMIGTFLLPACASQPPVPTESSEAAPATAEQAATEPAPSAGEATTQPAAGDVAPSTAGRDPHTLVIAVASDAGSQLDPEFGGGSEAENEFGKNIHGQWFQYARKDTGQGYLVADPNQFTGDLIESWEIEPDNMTVHLHLRQGLKFHDTGDEVTTEDIKAWMERAFQADAAGKWILNTGQVFSPDQLTVEGPYDFTIKLEAPTPLFFPLMRDQSSVVVNSKAIKTAEEAGDELAKEYLISNHAVPGEYKMTSRTPGVETVLEWDNTYWGEPPYFTKVILKVIPSSSDRALLLQQGTVDMARSLSLDELNGLRNAAGVKVWSVPSRDQVVLGLLNDHPPFDNPKVRQAIAHAVPYEDILEGVYQGQAVLSAGGPVPVQSAHQVGLNWPYTYDLEKAAALLAEAGLDDGFTFTLGLNAGNPQAEAMAILIQAELAKLGVTMDVVQDPDAVYGEKRFNSEYDAWIDAGWNAFVDSPYYYLFIFYRSGIYCCNFVNYANPRVDEINDILATETDPEKIMTLWKEAVQLIIEDAPLVFLVDANFQVATRNDIAGLVVEPDSLLSYRELYRLEQ